MFLQYINFSLLVGLAIGAIAGVTIFSTYPGTSWIALTVITPTTILILVLLRSNAHGYVMGLGIAFIPAGIFTAGLKGLWGLAIIAVAFAINAMIRQCVAAQLKGKLVYFLYKIRYKIRRPFIAKIAKPE